MSEVYYTYCATPIGKCLLTSDGKALTAIYFPCHQDRHAPESNWRRDDKPFVEVTRQLREYFAGERRQFDLPLNAGGTPFERKVWAALCRIPYGTTVSYGHIAQKIAQPKACRAVGLANGRNPIPIIVPCHRVIGANGSLTGYGGGLDIKRRLLTLEGVESQAVRPRQKLAAAR